MCYQNRLPGSSFALCFVALLLFAGAVSGQTTSFTYQGRLTDAGAPANNNYDLQFTLWDAVVGGTQQPQPAPATLTKTNVAVTGGVFSVLLDFGVSAFPGTDRFLEVGVRPAGSAAAFALLAPRQQISSTPYALRTLNATAADSLSSACVGCVQNAQISSVAASKLTGTLPASSVPAGSGSYIQNRGLLQPQNADFNISGNGFVGGDGFIGGNSFVKGNAEQARNKGGWVKAMALVSAGIARCYNSQMADGGASVEGCGFKVRASSSATFVDFGFQVSDRFISVTPARLLQATFVLEAFTQDQGCFGCKASEVAVRAPGPYYIFVF